MPNGPAAPQVTHTLRLMWSQDVPPTTVAAVFTGQDTLISIDRRGHMTLFDSNGGRHRSALLSHSRGVLRVSSMQRIAGDSIWTFDLGQNAVITLDKHGTVVRAIPLGLQSGRQVRPVGRLGDGTIIGQVPRGYRSLTSGVLQPIADYIRMTPDGEALAHIGTFAGDEAMLIQQRIDASHARRLFVRSPFGGGSLLAPGRDRIYVVGGVAPVLHVYSADGVVLTTVALGSDWVSEPHLVGNELPGVLTPTETDTVSQWLQDGERAGKQAMFRKLYVDEQNRLWAEAQPQSGSMPTEWFLFNPEGEPVARVRGVAGITLLSVNAEVLVAIDEPANRSRQLHVYRIVPQ
jgi:hypothetical protein